MKYYSYSFRSIESAIVKRGPSDPSQYIADLINTFNYLKKLNLHINKFPKRGPA